MRIHDGMFGAENINKQNIKYQGMLNVLHLRLGSYYDQTT